MDIRAVGMVAVAVFLVSGCESTSDPLAPPGAEVGSDPAVEIGLYEAEDCGGDIVLYTQTQVNDFPGCTVVGGMLMIRPGPVGEPPVDPDDPVTNLDALMGLERVEGALVITRNDELESMGSRAWKP